MNSAPRRPRPIPSELTQGFWDAAARHQLEIQRCNECGTWFHPPVPLCPNCHSEKLGFEPVAGQGAIYTYTRMTEPLVPGFEPPLVVVAVELDEQEGLVVVSNLIAAGEGDVRIGQRVEVTFEDLPDGGALPQFQPAIGGQS